MRAYSRAAQSYGSVQVVTGVATADNVQLIQMLFDGLTESLSSAKGHIQNNAIEEKSKALSRAGRIVVGLQGALDFERGGELAQNLNELYAYVTRRLLLLWQLCRRRIVNAGIRQVSAAKHCARPQVRG